MSSLAPRHPNENTLLAGGAPLPYECCSGANGAGLTNACNRLPAATSAAQAVLFEQALMILERNAVNHFLHTASSSAPRQVRRA
jgi:hypothetical protein